MDSRYLISVCAGRDQLPGIRAAQARGLKVIGLDHQAEPYAKHQLDLFLQVDILDTEECFRKISSLNLPLAGVVSWISEVGAVAAARLRERMRNFAPGSEWPGLSVQQVRDLTEKPRIRQILREQGLHCPAWIAASGPDALMRWMDEITGPYVLKPADSSGSRGVYKITAQAQVKSLFQEVQGYSRSGQVILEQFLEGTEYSVESILIDGEHHWLTTSERVRLFDTTATEIFTQSLAPPVHREMLDQITHYARALHLKNTPLHTEVIVSPSGVPTLVELAGRGGGSQVADGIVPAVTGYSITDAVLDTALNQPLKRPVPRDSNTSPFASLCFLTSRSGRLVAIRGEDQIKKMPGLRYEFYAKIGDELAEPKNDSSRVGYVLAVAPTQREARGMAHTARDLIHFEVKPEAPHE